MRPIFHHPVCRATIALCLMHGAGTAALAQERGQPTASSDDSGQIADIIVTATRRATSLQRTPQAISVVTGRDQSFKGQAQLEDLSK